MKAEQDVEQIVQQNTGLIAMLVGRTLRRCPRLPSVYDYDDLYSLGNIGLLSAARTYDPERGVAFSTYAYRCIEHAIMGALKREWDQQIDCVCLSQLPGEEDENQIEEQIADAAPDASAMAFSRCDRELLETAMAGLSKRQAEVIRSIYFEGEPISQIAHRWRLSMQAVQKQHLLGLKSLKQRLRNLGIRQWTD
jgi:RNA polymerase sigma factor (sigma-70 family)